MENKYRTPKLEEFYIGMECEHRRYDFDGHQLMPETARWEKTIIERLPIDEASCTFYRVKDDK